VGEFALKGIGRSLAAYNVLSANMSRLALCDISRQRGNSVAFGAKRTCKSLSPATKPAVMTPEGDIRWLEIPQRSEPLT
jgi:hypothetical protein